MRDLKPDPLGRPRNPLAIFLLALSFLSGVLTMAGLTTAKSIEATLPGYIASTWGFMLASGSGFTLVGMFWQGRVHTGLLLKRVGYFALTIASFIYAVVIILFSGWGGLTTGGIIAAFGVACAVQYRQLNNRVRAILRVAQYPEEFSDGESDPRPDSDVDG